MKWAAKDIEIYIKEKAFIDTVVIPLLPVSFGEEIKESASQSEFITLLSTLLEKQFAGRVLLAPPFTYLQVDGIKTAALSLEKWAMNIKENAIPHIYYLTSDSGWKMIEQHLKGTLLWVPALPIDQFNHSQKWTIVENQANQLVNFFIKKWHEKE
ncbi:YpiF family protein [Neobacillus sp. SM06]|uniref:YpiF family protein n=1 Tax=Neobacillus sp. SM06 TaxID=3422492 RepID=UPI003D2A2B92